MSIGESTLNEIVEDVCIAIVTHFYGKVVALPQTEADFRNQASTYFTKWNLPFCIGALDGCHIPLRRPQGTQKAFYNYKGFYSFNLMAIAGVDYKFMHASVGSAGTLHDSTVFRRTKLYEKIQSNTLRKCFQYNGSDIGYYLVADAAFALHPWLIKGYTHANQATDEQLFTTVLSSGRQIIENVLEDLRAI